MRVIEYVQKRPCMRHVGAVLLKLVRVTANCVIVAAGVAARGSYACTGRAAASSACGRVRAPGRRLCCPGIPSILSSLPSLSETLSPRRPPGCLVHTLVGGARGAVSGCQPPSTRRANGSTASSSRRLLLRAARVLNDDENAENI